MTIIEITTPEELYFILTHYKKVVLYFYVNWRHECIQFNRPFIIESRKKQNIDIIFCRINIDKLPDIQYMYDVNMYLTPQVIYLYNNKIVKKFKGNRSTLLFDYTYNFSKL